MDINFRTRICFVDVFCLIVLFCLAVHTNSIVFCVNYRKAPEHPFPAAQLDAFDSTLFIFDNAKKFEFSPDNVIFTGDSAGGLLSVNCWYRFQLSNYSFKPSGICLLYPALGYQLDTPRFIIHGYFHVY